MSRDTFIRSLYHPVQPAADSSPESALFYREYAPGELLRPYVHCYWELYCKDLPSLHSLSVPHSPLSYRVIADGCIDLILDTQQYNGILIAGIADTYFDVPMRQSASYFGIRFLPGAIHHFFLLSAGELFNQMNPSEELMGQQLSPVSSQLFETTHTRERIRIAELFLLEKMSRNEYELHPALGRSIYHILSSEEESIKISEVAEWISPRQLRRLFHEQIGCSPKLFSRIVRFQKTVRAMHAAKNTSPFYDHGYFDQAHFIKEFKSFYGETPSIIRPRTARGI